MTFCRSLPLLLTLQFLFPVSLSSQAIRQKADLIIAGGTVITMDGARTIYDDGAVVASDDNGAVIVNGSRAVHRDDRAASDDEVGFLSDCLRRKRNRKKKLQSEK